MITIPEIKKKGLKGRIWWDWCLPSHLPWPPPLFFPSFLQAHNLSNINKDGVIHTLVFLPVLLGVREFRAPAPHKGYTSCVNRQHTQRERVYRSPLLACNVFLSSCLWHRKTTERKACRSVLSTTELKLKRLVLTCHIGLLFPIRAWSDTRKHLAVTKSWL